MCVFRNPPVRQVLAAARPTAPLPERTAKTVVTAKKRRRTTGAAMGANRATSLKGTDVNSLRIARPNSNVRGGNLNY